jgi:hypothetical protein
LLNGEGVISQLQTRSNPHFAILSNCGDEMKTGSTSCRFGDSSNLAWGYTISVADAQIAAIAQVTGFTIATRDITPFTAAKTPIVSAWTD